MEPIYPEELKEKIQHLFKGEELSLVKHIGIEYIELSKDKVQARMPVDERTKQPFGLLHGGASVVLAESLASVGSWLNVDESKYHVVGMEINANHIRAMRKGEVIGTAKPLHKGQKTQVWEIDIRTPEGKLVCISRCTLAVVNRRD